MFERFSEQARRVVVLAQEEARLLGHNSIGTEHLLLGLVHEGGGISGQALRFFEITLAAAREAVAEIVGDRGPPPSGHIPFTPRAKTVLELSLREALRLHDDHIGTEHLLLALAGEGSGVGCRALEQLGAPPDAVMARLLELRADRGGTRSGRTGAPTRAVVRSEFRGPAGARAGGMAGPPAIARCSLCGRAADRVDRVLVAGGMLICERCARAAVAQLDELADDAPKRVRFRRDDSAPPDEREAIAAIERAFDAIVGPMRLPVVESFWAVEGGEELADELRLMERAAERAPVVINDISIERVRFVDVDEAEVSLGLWIAGNPSPMVQPAHAVRVDGTWRVSRDTVQRLAAQARMVAGPD